MPITKYNDKYKQYSNTHTRQTPNVKTSRMSLTLDPNIGGRGDGEDQEEEDEGKGLEGVGGDPADAVEDGAQEATLARAEAGASHVAQAPTVWTCRRVRYRLISPLSLLPTSLLFSIPVF